MRIRQLLTVLLALLATCVHAATATDVVAVKAVGDSLMNVGQYSQALEAYIQTMEQAERAGNQRLYIAAIGNIANIYAISGEYERCEYYLQKGYSEALQQRDSDQTANFIVNMVGIYSMMDNVERTSEAMEQLRHHRLSDTVKWHFYLIYSQGIVDRLRKDYAEAIRQSRRALDYAQQHHMELKYEMAQYDEIGGNYLDMGMPQEALRFFRMHLHKADSLDNRDLYMSSCRMLAEAYRQAGHPDSAQFYAGLYHTLRDSLLDQRQLSAAKEKLYQYENRRNEEQTRRLNEQVSRQSMLLTVLAGIVIVGAALLLVRLLRSRKPVSLDSHADADEVTAPTTTEAEDNAESASETRARIYLNDEQVRQLAQDIDTVMHDISVISNPDFSLQSLATRLGSNTKYVSYAINEVYGKTFKTLLNEVRIAEAARRLSDPEHYGNLTIQSIFQELGYNSAASFIQAFKKQKGMTPSQFMKLANGK